MTGAYGVQSHCRVINFSGEYFPLLNTPYPKSQSSVQDEISENSPERPVLGLVPSQFVIGVEGYGTNDNSQVPQHQFCIGESVGLPEFQRRKIIGQGIVSGVLEICQGQYGAGKTGLKLPTWYRVHCYLRRCHALR